MPTDSSAAAHHVQTVAVVGAGQMGGGIAQVAAVAGFPTRLYDASEASVGRCRANHKKLLDRAADMLRTSSYRDLKVVDIAREAGTSPATSAVQAR